jgi:hypothetical protein
MAIKYQKSYPGQGKSELKTISEYCILNLPPNGIKTLIIFRPLKHSITRK